MTKDFSSIEQNEGTFLELDELNYQEINTVGRFLLFPHDVNEENQFMPSEIKFFCPRTPWSLRQLVERNKTYRIKTKVWSKNGLITRNNDLPAEITYHPNGKVHELKWFNASGLYHRENGKPAIIRFNIDGLIEQCFWLISGQDCSDKIIEFCINNQWDYLRLNKEQIEKIKTHFFSPTEYI